MLDVGRSMLDVRPRRRACKPNVERPTSNVEQKFHKRLVRRGSLERDSQEVSFVMTHAR